MHGHLRGGKPVIYLYPPKPLRCKLSLDLVDIWTLSHLYPRQLDKAQPRHITWIVNALPNGDLRLASPPHTVLPYLVQRRSMTPTNNHCPCTSSTRRRCPRHPSSPYLDKTLELLKLDLKQRADFTYRLPQITQLRNVAFRFATPSETGTAADLRVILKKGDRESMAREYRDWKLHLDGEAGSIKISSIGCSCSSERRARTRRWWRQIGKKWCLVVVT